MRVRTTMAIGVIALSLGLMGSTAQAEEEKVTYGHQLQFRGAYSALTTARGNEVFTDTVSAGGLSNNSNGGYSIAAVLDLSAMEIERAGGMRLMGEIFIEYSNFWEKRVVRNRRSLLGGTATSDVAVTGLNVTVAPKARFDDLGNGRFRPFVIPIGLAFLVNSPPSNDTTYLDLGLHFGGGLDVLITDHVSVGWDVRYTYGFQQTNTNTRYWSSGGYVALNF